MKDINTRIRKINSKLISIANRDGNGLKWWARKLRCENKSIRG